MIDKYAGIDRHPGYNVDRNSVTVISDSHSECTGRPCVAGQTAIFRCYVSGDPRPSVEWSRGDWRPVMSRDRVRQYVDDDGSDVMELDDASAADAGEYTVTATNEFGSCSATATLVIDMTAIGLPAPLQDM